MRQLNFIKILKTLFLDSKNTTTQNHLIENNSTLLIIRLDAIGDYILFRNFLEVIRNSEKFKNHKITLCGNEIWKEITDTFDKKFIDESIWINRNKFKSDRNYRNEKLKFIASQRFDWAIETTTSRDLYFGDAIIKASNAANRIGKNGDTCNTIGFWKFFTDKYYTRLIDVKNAVFEFESNKKLFEVILNAQIPIPDTSIDLQPNIQENTIVLFPGASEKTKQWSPENFAQVANYLLGHTSYEIVIAGAQNDSYLAEQILKQIENKVERINNLCGTTNLYQLINLIGKAKLLISSDTAAIHIGIAVKTKSIGFFDGRHFGRFAPYPYVSETMGVFLYPTPIGDYRETYDYWVHENNEKNLGFNINNILPEDVIRYCKKLLSPDKF